MLGKLALGSPANPKNSLVSGVNGRSSHVQFPEGVMEDLLCMVESTFKSGTLSFPTSYQL